MTLKRLFGKNKGGTQDEKIHKACQQWLNDDAPQRLTNVPVLHDYPWLRINPMERGDTPNSLRLSCFTPRHKTQSKFIYRKQETVMSLAHMSREAE